MNLYRVCKAGVRLRYRPLGDNLRSFIGDRAHAVAGNQCSNDKDYLTTKNVVNVAGQT